MALDDKESKEKEQLDETEVGMRMESTMEHDLDELKGAIESYPNFPKDGIMFYDIFSLFANASHQKLLDDVLLRASRECGEYDVIVGLDARGFLLGPLISVRQEKPFLPIRKAGKLPGETVKKSYNLEYGSDVVEIQKGRMPAGSKVLVVDDLLATGGTLKAACDLIQAMDCTVTSCLVVIELTDLKGKENVPAPVKSLVQFSGEME